MLQPDQVLVCVDYFFDERQRDMLRPYLLPGASLIVGNWCNRTPCLLRLVDIIAKEGDCLVVDSDVVLAGEFPEVDRWVEEPLYHVAESPRRHRRVVRVERGAAWMFTTGASRRCGVGICRFLWGLSSPSG
jgi:hypothetical protein